MKPIDDVIRTDSHTVDTPWLDVRRAAARTLVSAATIRREAKKGRLVSYRVGGRRLLRFRAADVDAWLMRSTTPVLVQQHRRA